MKVFLDTTPLSSGHAGRGIGVYTKNLVSALKNIPTVGVTTGPISEGGFECDLIHYPYFDFFYRTLPLFKLTKTVITIHDTIPLIKKKVVKPGLRGEFNHLFQRLSLKSVSAIITDSQNSKNDIAQYLRYPQDRIHAIPLAVSQDFVNHSRIKPPKSQLPALPARYLLFVGDIDFNKNLPHLIQAFSAVKTDVDLVIVSRALGRDTAIPEAQAIIQAVSHSGKYGRIHLLSDCQDNVLPHVYSRALGYIQPSLYEGFGLPILEAFYSRIPVACAHTSSLPEVAGSAAFYFDPANTASIQSAIITLAELSADRRQEQISRGLAQLEKFSWPATARATVSVYQKVLAV